MNSLRVFGPDAVCSQLTSFTTPTPIPIQCNTGINNVCVDPLTRHIIIYYTDGNIQDTGIVANCGTSCFELCEPGTCPCPGPTGTSISCTPRTLTSYINGVEYTKDNEMIFTYNDGNMCSLGEICKCQTVIFSQNQVPTCGCPPAKCGDIFINLETGNIYAYFGYAWDIIGNLIGHSGPTGPSGLVGPTGPVGLYEGTGFFGPGFTGAQTTTIDEMTATDAINLLRQPNTYYPTQFGQGIGTGDGRFPDSEAIVLGNHSDMTGPNGAIYSVAIGSLSGQVNQGTGAIAIGGYAGYDTQGEGAIAIGKGAGMTGMGARAIAIGNNAGIINQPDDSFYTIPNLANCSGSVLLYDVVTGQIGPQVSSLRFKKNIQPLDKAKSDVIHKLQPVTFKHFSTNKPSLGLIAEEVYKYIPEITPLDEFDEPISVNYELLSVLLLDQVQRLRKDVDELTRHVNKLMCK